MTAGNLIKVYLECLVTLRQFAALDRPDKAQNEALVASVEARILELQEEQLEYDVWMRE